MFEINRWNYVFKFYREVQWHAKDLLASFVPKQLLILDAIFCSLLFFVITVINPEWNNRFVKHSTKTLLFSDLAIFQPNQHHGIGLILQFVPSTNKAAKVLATCLWNCQKPLLSFTSLWPKILNNSQHWHQKCNWWHRKELYE